MQVADWSSRSVFGRAGRWLVVQVGGWSFRWSLVRRAGPWLLGRAGRWLGVQVCGWSCRSVVGPASHYVLGWSCRSVVGRPGP